MTQEAAKKERVAKVIEVLNKARSMELYAVHQYMNQHYNLDDLDYGEFASKIKLIAIDEMRHGELFAEGIKADPTRIAAQIVSGVGFLGAGMIFMRHRTLTGLTTAAGIWTTAGIGMAVGCGLYAVSLFSTALVVLTQLMLHRDYRWTRAPGCTAVCLRTQPGPSGLRQALAALDEMQVQVINLEASHKRSGVHYELFVRLPPGLAQERLGAQLAALEEVIYVDI